MRTLPVAPLVVVVLLLLGSLAAAQARPRAFVTNEKSNDVTVIDVLTAKVVKTIPRGRSRW
jgi:YVTN family beta-propeller protein